MSSTTTPNTPFSKNISSISVDCGGNPIVFETGRFANRATKTVSVKCGDTVVIVPCVGMPKPSEANFLPQSIHYAKRAYADGQIPGSRDRQDTRATDAESMASRLIDRPLRATFPKGFYHEVQISPLVVSSDPNIKSDILALLGAASALALSGLPVRGPVAAVRVGYIEKKFVINPTQEQMEGSALDLVIAGTETSILMVEAEANALLKEVIGDAIAFGLKQLQLIAKAIREWKEKAGEKPWVWEAATLDQTVEHEISAIATKEMASLYNLKDKALYKQAREKLREHLVATFKEKIPEISEAQIGDVLRKAESDYMRSMILEKQQRLDGRKLDTIRPIQIEVGLLPRAHGSALFTRGDTQALVTATLGSDRDAQLVEGLDGVTRRDSFIMHYIFPPHCVGEVGKIGPPKRREQGHGNLAKRAMRAVLPNEVACPYVLRVVSEIMSSNGSSSMATVCGATLALMDAGIHLKTKVAGIAMGLIKEGNRSVVLSDISEEEDHIGHMDLKVAGTRDGITALQMDIKTDGISHQDLMNALTQAQKGLHHILDKMDEAIQQPREKVSLHAPQIKEVTIPTDKIQVLIGKGGATIRSITEETGTLVDINRESGLIRISAPNGEACDWAIQRVKEVTDVGPAIEVGTLYEGMVVKLLQSGAIVSILPGRKGFVHIDQVSLDRPDQKMSEALQEKQRIMVKVLEVDSQTNKIKLTMKGIIQKKEKTPESSE